MTLAGADDPLSAYITDASYGHLLIQAFQIVHTLLVAPRIEYPLKEAMLKRRLLPPNALADLIASGEAALQQPDVFQWEWTASELLIAVTACDFLAKTFLAPEQVATQEEDASWNRLFVGTSLEEPGVLLHALQLVLDHWRHSFGHDARFQHLLEELGELAPYVGK